MRSMIVSLTLALGLLSGCGEVDQRFDCGEICNEFDECLAPFGTDEAECYDQCVDNATDGEVDRCEECVDSTDNECLDCSVACGDVFVGS